MIPLAGDAHLHGHAGWHHREFAHALHVGREQLCGLLVTFPPITVGEICSACSASSSSPW
ncbi:MAG: hypothetical protein U0168_04895 [Nannocystaceae bacterium]